jgi:hypothetical protein
MSDNQTQCDNLLRYLNTGRSVTAMTALDLWGIFRLAARIYQLKQRGHHIESHTIKVGKKHVAAYLIDRSA